MIAFCVPARTWRTRGIASARRPCSVRTHHACSAPATRKRDVSDSPSRFLSSETAHAWSAVAQSQASPLAEQMPCPYWVIFRAVQRKWDRAEIRPATTLVLPTLREWPPMTMIDIFQMTKETRQAASLLYIFADSAFFVERDKNANSLRYSRIGRAGVPQKTTPLPRITFFDGMPLCAPRIAPASMRT